MFIKSSPGVDNWPQKYISFIEWLKSIAPGPLLTECIYSECNFYAEERNVSFKFQILLKYLMNWSDDSTVSSQQSKLLMNKYFIEGTQTSFNELQ